MLTTFLPLHSDAARPSAAVGGARTAPAPGLRARRGTPSDDLVRSLFGPWVATVEELVARDIAAFTTRRLARP
ncbi:hypothetical protein IGS67_08845 [Flavimobilis sp. GY10621]|uniref:Uncharacterized protein n=1 Tax=Flavimobilis rhizosphaerae TaxID=2775421 RepID=A0ABR9DR57_9MICO|nr:hypothetical protein [Flavimobilis rhizosphaerae]MBD9699593.1 hypothetical protein [Flavimobilis rhizosphaerae]